jgi:hypothetical protein
MNPAYITFEDVKERLAGKVKFSDDDSDNNLMPRSLAIELINEAEGNVEQDLSPRFQAPFVHSETGKFKDLPDRPTKNIIRRLCTIRACILILEDDFGSGSNVDASKYVQSLEKRYDSIINDKILAKREGGGSGIQWAFPPLPFLMKNYFNRYADDGYIGMVHVTSSGDGDYPAQQINDPSETFWNGVVDDPADKSTIDS